VVHSAHFFSFLQINLPPGPGLLAFLVEAVCYTVCFKVMGERSS
jgi:hypothetical protein